MSTVRKFIKLFQALSFDVALGGAIGTLFVSKYVGVDISIFTLLELTVCIWLIYTLDHLLDAGIKNTEPVTFRHRYHWKNSTIIWSIWSFLLIAAFSFLFLLPKMTLVYGSIVALIVCVYFISIRLLKGDLVYHKEFIVAVVYSTGIFVGPMSIYSEFVTWDIWALFIEYTALALINLILFSIYEKHIDSVERFHSLVISMGQRKVIIIVWILLLLIFSTSIILISLDPRNISMVRSQVIIITMNFILLLILIMRNFFEKNQRYRTIADAVFFVPVLFLINW